MYANFREHRKAKFAELRKGEVRRIPFYPRTPLNRGMKKDQGCLALARCQALARRGSSPVRYRVNRRT